MRVSNLQYINNRTIKKKDGYKKYTGLSNEAKNTLIALARKGASIGEYMGEKTGGAFIRSYVKKNVTPNYSAVKGHILGMISRSRCINQLIRNYCGNYRSYSFRCNMGMLNDFAEVYDRNGQQVLVYDSRYGWCQTSNAEEKKAFDEMTAIYVAAYDEARAEMRQQGYITSKGETILGFDPTSGIELPISKFDCKS